MFLHGMISQATESGSGGIGSRRRNLRRASAAGSDRGGGDRAYASRSGPARGSGAAGEFVTYLRWSISRDSPTTRFAYLGNASSGTQVVSPLAGSCRSEGEFLSSLLDERVKKTTMIVYTTQFLQSSTVLLSVILATWTCIVRLRLFELFQEEKRALDARKVLHIRELKRVAHEDRSKFSKRPTLSGRYNARSCPDFKDIRYK